MTADQTGALLLFGMFAFMAYQGFKSADQSAKLETEKKVSNEAENQEQLEFIRGKKALLPDCEAIVNALRERYTWQQIFQAYGVGTLEMELLRMVPLQSTISLPNLKASDQTDEERRVLRDAKRARSTFDDHDDLETWIQEPTAETLWELVDSGLVDATEIGYGDGRDFKVDVTLRGELLLELDEKYRDQKSRFEIPKLTIMNIETQRELASLVRPMINAGKKTSE